ncbi:hypothetical protein BZA70DRAFT_271629 [Myxozyma melibiosi]|uniref:FAR1 domain-containing protein n=1 Tax=Myxozyma melibiosi TaxID=54550 RepID=A0ABR1FCI2_9ASCO
MTDFSGATLFTAGPMYEEKPQTQHCSNCHYHHTLDRFGIAPNGMRRKTCRKRKKKEVVYDSWSEFLEFAQDWHDKEDLELMTIEKRFLIKDLPVSFTDTPNSINNSPDSGISDKLQRKRFHRPATQLMEALFKAGGYRFKYRGTSSGKILHFDCCQDETRVNTKRDHDGRLRQRDRVRMTRFPCEGRLVLYVDVEMQIVSLRLNHKHHEAYNDTGVTPAMRDSIDERILEISPCNIYRSLTRTNIECQTAASLQHVS